ncbi:TRAP transporter small permease [Paremcibacter congregatus]|uniref:TRAP transporter small permease n=1 Tax=Paremcibacter congregatus TaxID=2043170 RepID=UPI003A937FED
MKKWISRLDRLLIILLVALMAILVMLIVWQVFARYILNDPSSVTEELARFVLIWTALLGASYAFRMRMHLGLNLFTQKLKGRHKSLAEFAALAAVAIFALVVMIIGGGRLMLLTADLNQLTAALGIPVAYVYSVLPLSGGLFLIYIAEFCRELLQSGAIAVADHEREGSDYE